MNFYDKIHEMVRAFKETTEYKEYMRLKDEIKKQDKVYAQIKEFKDKQKQHQLDYINGKQLDEASQNEMQNLYSLIIQDENSRKLLEYEMKLDVMLADMQKIMGDAIKDIVEF